MSNITTLIQSLESLQIELEKQISLKNEQIKILENCLIELHFKLSSFSNLSHAPQNFEALKQEIIEMNNIEMNYFFQVVSGIFLGAFLVFLIIQLTSKGIPLAQNNYAVDLVDSNNDLIWEVKIIENEIAEIIIRDFNSEAVSYAYLEQPERTLILRSSDSISVEALENIEIINSCLSETEKAIAATQIVEILNSFGFS